MKAEMSEVPSFIPKMWNIWGVKIVAFERYKQDWVATMSKPIALFKKKYISLVRLKVISFLG